MRQYGRTLRFGARLAPERRAELLERFADERFLTDLREEALPALDQALAIHRTPATSSGREMSCGSARG